VNGFLRFISSTSSSTFFGWVICSFRELSLGILKVDLSSIFGSSFLKVGRPTGSEVGLPVEVGTDSGDFSAGLGLTLIFFLPPQGKLILWKG
jgi:hypothetical protein